MIKRLSRCIREYKLFTVITPVLAASEVAMEVLIPWLMGKLIDNGVYKSDTPYVVRTGIILIILCLLSLFFGVACGVTAAKASSGFAKNLRHDMFHNIQSFSFANIDKFSTSGLVTRLTTDVTNLQNSFQMIIRIAVRSPSMLIFSLAMSFKIDAKLSLIFLAGVPVLNLRTLKPKRISAFVSSVAFWNPFGPQNFLKSPDIISLFKYTPVAITTVFQVKREL